MEKFFFLSIIIIDEIKYTNLDIDKTVNKIITQIHKLIIKMIYQFKKKI